MSASLVETARLLLAALGCGLGVLAMLGGMVGVLRFPDFYTRLHACLAALGLGAGSMCLGLAFAAGEMRTALKLALLALLVAALAPVLAQILGAAAHAGGLAPLSGGYVAPRPGAPRREPEA